MRNRLFTLFGGTGFIGRYVVERLADRGARILVISRSPSTHGRHLQPLGAVDQIVVQSVDLSSEAALRRAVAGAAGVINLIGILYETGRQQFAEVQGALPGRIAAAARAEGVPRLVQISAIGADRGSASAYARSKAEGERRVREAFPDATILRPSIVIGPEDGFFNRFAALARILPALPLIGGGQTRFQPVYVGDVAQAVVAALERDDSVGPDLRAGRAPGLHLRRADALHVEGAGPAPPAAERAVRRGGAAGALARAAARAPPDPGSGAAPEAGQRGCAGHARPGRARHHARPRSS